jgi:16S rRNA (guanine966-N2)-methyltransferase
LAAMRIIAGEFRGRRILPPRGTVTRPVTDRAKQSIFDVLSPQLADAIVYDCFAGTGSMGLEALSRGSRLVTFFETDRSAVQLLEQNRAALKVEDRSTIVTADLFRWFELAPPPARRVDLVFLDPPYRFVRERAEILQSLARRLADHLNPAATIIFRHDAADILELAPLHRFDVRDYGPMRVEFLTV